jgi:hypothetical protein
VGDAESHDDIDFQVVQLRDIGCARGQERFHLGNPIHEFSRLRFIDDVQNHQAGPALERDEHSLVQRLTRSGGKVCCRHQSMHDLCPLSFILECSRNTASLHNPSPHRGRVEARRLARQSGNFPGLALSPVNAVLSGEAYKVLSQDRRRAVGYVYPSICTFVEE